MNSISSGLRASVALLAIALFCAVSTTHAGTVYKCTTAQGSVAFQDHPCAAAQNESRVEIAAAPAYAPSPDYAVERDADAHAAHHSTTTKGRASRAPRSVEATSYECRAATGEVFYRHSTCPHSIAAKGAGKSRGATKTVAVSATRVSREEACTQIRRAGAAGRSGHAHDEDVSTYDKNLGRDLCG